MSETVMYEDVADYIDAHDLGQKGVDMFGGRMPARPDFMIGLYEHTGFEPIRAMGSRRIDQIVLQVIVRDVSPTVARARLYDIVQLLDVEFNLQPEAARVINGVQYYSILARHSPSSLGQDENSRFKWSCNFLVTRD
jgi:hypothetical protein